MWERKYLNDIFSVKDQITYDSREMTF